MKDDIETLCRFIGLRDESAGNYPDDGAVDARAALDRIVAERDSLRKSLDDRWAADQRAAKAIFAATGRTSGFPSVKDVVAFYIAEVERLEKELSVAREAIKAQNGVVLSSVEKTIEARKKLPCGHHASSLVKSVESDTQLCEVCDLMSQRDDAVAMEEQLRAERDGWKSRAQQFQRERAELADKLNGTPCAEIRWQYERDAARAKLDRAKEALSKIDGFEVNALDSMVNQVFRLKNMARAVLSELSTDAPAQPPQISAREMKDACVGVAIRVIERWQCHTGYGVAEAIEAGNAILAGIQSISLDSPAQQTQISDEVREATDEIEKLRSVKK